MGSATNHLRARSVRRKRRGTVLLEFMFIAPLFLFLCLFSIDMGRLMVISGALNDAAYVAARSGAQRGSAYENDNAQRAFTRAVDQIPMNGGDGNRTFTIDQGNCNSANSYVVVATTQDVSLITPGLGQLLDIFTGEGDKVGGTWSVSSRAAVLCEIVRS